MTASTPAAPLPRARTLVHPGPVGPIRLEHRHANRARHFRLVLAPGRTMHDALAWPLRALGIGACSMTLLGGRLASLLYCVAPPDPSGERVANYTRPIPAGASTSSSGPPAQITGARGSFTTNAVRRVAS